MIFDAKFWVWPGLRCLLVTSPRCFYLVIMERCQTHVWVKLCCVSSGGVCDRQLSPGQTHGGPQRAGQTTDGEGAARRPAAHLRQQTGTVAMSTRSCDLSFWLGSFLCVHVCRMSPAACRWRRWRSCWAFTSCAAGGAGTSRAATPAAGWDSTRGWTGSPGSWWQQGSWMWPNPTLYHYEPPASLPSECGFKLTLLTSRSHLAKDKCSLLHLKAADFDSPLSFDSAPSVSPQYRQLT